MDINKLRGIMNKIDNTINQAYELDEELDIGLFLERLSEINNELEELLEEEEYEHE